MADQRPAVRVGDREREEVVGLLRGHAAEGRLDPDEFEQRLEAAYAARTQADLAALTRDLPRAVAEPEHRRPRRQLEGGLSCRVDAR